MLGVDEHPVPADHGLALGRCRGCGLSNETNGNCSNTCGTPAVPTCGGRERVSVCSTGGPDESTCNGRYILGEFELAQSSYYDAGSCQPCDIEDDLTGACDNVCQ